MRTSALARLSTVAAVLMGATLLAAPAVADEPAPPVPVADTLTLWPGQLRVIDVLANDVSPSGDDLALCRFPELDVLLSSKVPSVVASHSAAGVFKDGTAGEGDVVVSAGPRAHGTHVIDYYVCDHTHLVPATLTVVIREVEPVDVRKVKGERGRITVTNHNTVPIRFWFGHPRAWRPDGTVTVPAGASRTVAVQRHRIAWAAIIGSGTTKGSLLKGPGLAGMGVVKDIKLKGEPLPKPKSPDLDEFDVVEMVGRWSA